MIKRDKTKKKKINMREFLKGNEKTYNKSAIDCIIATTQTHMGTTPSIVICCNKNHRRRGRCSHVGGLVFIEQFQNL